MSEENKKFIDVAEVIRSKNPRLYKMLPGFVTRYIKRVVHEDEVNDFIARHGHKTSFEFVDAIIEYRRRHSICSRAYNGRYASTVPVTSCLMKSLAN